MSNKRTRRRSGARRTTPKAQSARAALDAPAPFTFTHRGKRYSLPPASKAAAMTKAGDLIDAVMDADPAANLRLMIASLRQLDVDRATMAALRDKPIDEFMSILQEWAEASGASLGKSARSLS